MPEFIRGFTAGFFTATLLVAAILIATGLAAMKQHRQDMQETKVEIG